MTNRDEAKDVHPDWNDLARLADEGPDQAEPALLDHLATCPPCQAAWAEAVRYRGARVLGTDSYEVPPELAAQARDLIGTGPASNRILRRSPRFWRPRPTLVAGGGLLAAVLALFILLPSLRPGQDPTSSHPLIRAELALQSAHGMVYPGVAGQGASGHPVYRSGTETAASLKSELNRMYESWQQDAGASDDTWWLAAGCIATGRLGLASDLVDQSLRRAPDDVRLLHLEAITAWQLSELERAEYTLHKILTLAPADSTAMFNLALIQIDEGRADEAADLLQKLAVGSRNHLLQERAREVLRHLD